MSKTIEVKAPNPPEWVKEAGAEARWAWYASLGWRCDAASATTDQYKKLLIRDAKHAYHDDNL